MSAGKHADNIRKVITVYMEINCRKRIYPAITVLILAAIIMAYDKDMI